MAVMDDEGAAVVILVGGETSCWRLGWVGAWELVADRIWATFCGIGTGTCRLIAFPLARALLGRGVVI